MIELSMQAETEVEPRRRGSSGFTLLLLLLLLLLLVPDCKGLGCSIE